MDITTLFWIAVGIGTAISAWFTGVRMRRRIRRALGKSATDAELVSLNTWMKVHASEQHVAETSLIGKQQRLHKSRGPGSGQ